MKRAQFNMNYTKLFSCDMGELIPCGIVDVLPGDSMQLSTTALIRAAALLSPVMHPTEVRIHHWFVPHRLVWTDFEKFITGGQDGLDATAFPTIAIPGGGFALGSLADYLGVPPSVGATLPVSALPFRSYALIWNEWYRDQDLQTALTVNLGNGADATTNTTLQNCAWEKDYFTSARPWEQKGASITVPLGTTAPIIRNPTSGAIANSKLRTSSTGNLAANASLAIANGTGDMVGAGGTTQVTLDPNGSLVADLAAATGVSVNTLRASLALQRFQEARARYGSRYVEYLRALGVRSSDARLNRPEYLGGGRQTIQFSEVVATAETGTSVDVGDLKGHGIAAMRSNKFRTFFEEHGYVISLMSIKPKTIYMNGLFKHWNRRTKTDYWQRELQHIGQQAIARKEVYLAAASPDAVFGYQDRYDEYRRMESSVSAEFRTSLLNFWHMARDFGSEPSLNSTFVSSVPTERVFAVPSQDVMYVHARHNMQMRRLVAPKGNSYIF